MHPSSRTFGYVVFGGGDGRSGLQNGRVEEGEREGWERAEESGTGWVSFDRGESGGLVDGEGGEV